jgi:hypothetical protein
MFGRTAVTNEPCFEFRLRARVKKLATSYIEVFAIEGVAISIAQPFRSYPETTHD